MKQPTLFPLILALTLAACAEEKKSSTTQSSSGGSTTSAVVHNSRTTELRFSGNKARALFQALGGDRTATTKSPTPGEGREVQVRINQRADLKCQWSAAAPASCTGTIEKVPGMDERHPEELVRALSSLAPYRSGDSSSGTIAVDSITCAKRTIRVSTTVVLYSCEVLQSSETGI